MKEEYLDIFEHDKMARTLWTGGDTATELNKYQLEAIKLALTNSFQLIQGPPG